MHSAAEVSSTEDTGPWEARTLVCSINVSASYHSTSLAQPQINPPVRLLGKWSLAIRLPHLGLHLARPHRINRLVRGAGIALLRGVGGRGGKGLLKVGDDVVDVFCSDGDTYQVLWGRGSVSV